MSVSGSQFIYLSNSLSGSVIVSKYCFLHFDGDGDGDGDVISSLLHLDGNFEVVVDDLEVVVFKFIRGSSSESFPVFWFSSSFLSSLLAALSEELNVAFELDFLLVNTQLWQIGGCKLVWHSVALSGNLISGSWM